MNEITLFFCSPYTFLRFFGGHPRLLITIFYSWGGRRKRRGGGWRVGGGVELRGDTHLD